MKKASITICFEDDKLAALEFSLKKGGSSVQKEMNEALGKLYEKTVPAPLREFLDSRLAQEGQPKRPRPQQPKAPQKTSNETAQGGAR